MLEPRGPAWCARYPTSASLGDLEASFAVSVGAFLKALREADADVEIHATYRPPERAYLMHWACQVAGYRDKAGAFIQCSPFDVPPMDGVDIDWTHGGDMGVARAAAVAMRDAYGVVFPASLTSLHCLRRAIDMTIAWEGPLAITNATSQRIIISSAPRDGGNFALWQVGKTYGVIKLDSDPPHWSDTGR